MKASDLKEFLDNKVALYNQTSFIERDPISIPHRFSKKQDIEISGLFAALFAWGNRTIIINKSYDLLHRMDNAPFDFVRNAKDKDLKKIIGFKHRTFQDGDILFLLHFLQQHYAHHNSLEDAFMHSSTSANEADKKSAPESKAKNLNKYFSNIPIKESAFDPLNVLQERMLHNFYEYVFSFPHLKRSEKHISTPTKNSACKRMNMFLRWMVRHDDKGVDFGIWKKISPAQLIIPLDVHVMRVAKGLGLLQEEKANWQQATALTDKLRIFDPSDPVKYDYALFSLGVSEKF